jgi:hypothetical protein
VLRQQEPNPVGVLVTPAVDDVTCRIRLEVFADNDLVVEGRALVEHARERPFDERLLVVRNDDDGNLHSATQGHLQVAVGGMLGPSGDAP